MKIFSDFEKKQAMNAKMDKSSKSSDNSQGFGGGDTESEDDGSGKVQDKEYKKS